MLLRKKIVTDGNIVSKKEITTNHKANAISGYNKSILVNCTS